MKRSTVPAKKNAQAIVIQQVALPCAEEFVTRAREWIDTLRSLDDAALFLIANGVFCLDDGLPLAETFESVAEAVTDVKAVLTKVEQLAAVIRKGGLTDVQRCALGDLEDKFISVGNAYAEGGYLLGIAVGQALGPDAFKGCAR